MGKWRVEKKRERRGQTWSSWWQWNFTFSSCSFIKERYRARQALTSRWTSELAPSFLLASYTQTLFHFFFSFCSSNLFIISSFQARPPPSLLPSFLITKLITLSRFSSPQQKKKKGRNKNAKKLKKKERRTMMMLDILKWLRVANLLTFVQPSF